MARIEVTTEDQALLNKIAACKKESEDHLKPWHGLCNERYRLYRGVKAYREAFRKASPPDRDDVMRDAGRDWSADLHIPMAYSTVETILPRAVSNRPRGLVLPDELSAEENIENMRSLIERQQERMRYELVNQETAKSGFIFGLGAQKLTWRKKVQGESRYLRRATDKDAVKSEYVEDQKKRVIYDDPWAEDISIFDLFWDPFGYDSFTLRWILHRTRRPADYVISMIRSGIWDSTYAQALEDDEINGMTGGEIDALEKERLTAAGHTNVDTRGGRMHEVWEYHDGGDQVVTILNGQIPVRISKNPFWHGEMPFHFYRPTTPGIKQLHGIGEIEPLADLIRELDTLRSQRRDNAAFVLQTPLVFDEDAIDRAHIQVGPGIGIPAHGGGASSVRDFLQPIQMGDIPHSSYREEEQLKADADRTSGISDAVTGAEGMSGGAAATATGAQLVTAAANVRIENKSRRLEVETVAPLTNQQIGLNQQMIVSRTERVPREPEPGEMYPKLWQFVELSPDELKGGMSYVVEGGSMAPKNPAQDAQQGQNLWSALNQDPEVDRTRLLKYYIESQGIKQAQTWLKPPAPTVPPQVLDALRQRFGDDVDAITSYVMNGQGQG